MTNNTIPHDHRHHHRLRPHHQEMDQLQALAVKPQVKKQARRRTHTSRPYQERLLNMAEARREIVTALKIHRASTSSTRKQQQSTFQPRQEPPLQLQQQQEEQKQQVKAVAFQDRSQAVVAEEASLAHTTTMSYAATSFCNPLCSSPAAHWIATGSSCCAPATPPILRLPCALTPPELPLPTAAAMGGLVELEHEHEHYQGDLERLVRSLPAQPLGLNLSFQGFGVAVDDDGAKNDDCEDLFGSLPLTQPAPAASYSYSPPAVETTATTHACGGHGSPSPALSATDAENEKRSVVDAPAAAAAAAALVPVLLDDGGMEMTTTMAQQQASAGGETQGAEWTADVAAWWSKIFESGQRAPPNAEDVAAAGLPPAEWRWLCGDDDVVGAAEQGAVTVATTMHVGDGGYDYSCCYEGGRSDDGEDVTLPCMDGGIGEDVQGWDGEWCSHVLD